MSRAPIPVVLIAGFLGSGKTTLLNHILAEGGPTGRVRSRIGVLVNDFGAVNIDAMLVAGQADGTVSLANGCVCCSVDADGLDTALSTLLRPAAQMDAIVIEASGIAEPTSLIRLVTSNRDPRIRYGGLVYVVDAAQFTRVRHDHPELDAHIGVADLVVINKADLVSQDDLDDLAAVVSTLNASAPHVIVTDARVDPRMLFDPKHPIGARPADDLPQQLSLDELMRESGSTNHAHTHPAQSPSAPHTHLHDHYTSVEFSTAQALDPRRLAEFLERPPAGVFRIKGVVRVDAPGHRQAYVVHAVGGFVGIRRAPGGRKSASAPTRVTNLVVIGVGLDHDAVYAALEATVATAETADDEHGILHITRYLPQP